MVTKKQFLAQIDRIYKAASKLSREQEELAKMVDEVLGGDYVCDLCGGNEIEFRPMGDNDVYEDGCGQFNHSTKYAEDVLERLIK